METPNNQKVTAIAGVMIDGVFWHFEEAITSKTGIEFAAEQNGKKWAFRLLMAMGGFSLFLAFLAFVLQPDAVLGAGVLGSPKIALFFFWLSVLFGLVLFSQAIEKKRNVPVLPRAKELATEVTFLPSVESVGKHDEMSRFLSSELRTALYEAMRQAQKSGHAQVSDLHLFLGMMPATSMRMLFMRLGVSFEGMKGAIGRKMAALPKGTTVFDSVAREAVAGAFLRAVAAKQKTVGAVELFSEIFENNPFLQELFYSLEAEATEVRETIQWLRINKKLKERFEAFRQNAAFKPTGPMNRAYTSVATPFLDRVSEDLTDAGVKGYLPMLMGRDEEMALLLRAIEGGHQSVVLVGPVGVGKKSIVSGLAERMIQEDVPDILQDKRLVKISIPHILSAQGGGGADERFLYTLQEVGKSGNIILVIDGIEQIMGSGGGPDLSAILSSELEKGYTFVIATTTLQGYANFVERNILHGVLQKIDIREPDNGLAMKVLQSKIGAIENKNHAVFTYEALSNLIDLSARYMHESFLPKKAILLAEEVGFDVGKRGAGWQTVTKDDVAAIISQKTNIPVTQVSQDEGEKLLSLESRMHERVIGQDEAVTSIANALRRARVDLRSKDRPIANFLFLGPTGVGKTELAKTTAEVYFGDENSMLRFDMSEFQDQASIARLIGGNNESGLLTEAVRKSPFALVLLDELEKAHPDILNLFLQVMDDGRLTDGLGRTIDFTNVILIATSNAGTSYIQEQVKLGTALNDIRGQLMETELKKHYRPEFLNRLDGIVVFKPLTMDDVSAIAYLMINKVVQRLSAKGITFKATDEAIHELAQKGYDPQFGARPLRRVVQEEVDNAVAEFLLSGQVDRRDTLVLNLGGEITIEKAKAL